MSMPLDSSSPILTLPEAASFIGLSVESVRKYVQKGRLKPVATIGRAYLFTQAACEKFKPTIKPVGNPNFSKQKRRQKAG